MDKPTVLIADEVAPECDRILQAHGVRVQRIDKPSEAQLLQAIRPVHGLIVRSAVKVTPKVIEAGQSLKVVGRAGIGIDNIDVDAATRRGIVVINTPMGNITSAAEHTWALFLAMSRNIVRAHNTTVQGRWERKSFVGVELDRKTLGIVGLGKVGAQVTRLARGFNMKVIAHDPFLAREKIVDLGAEPVDLPTLLRESDFITIHIPLTDATRGLIGAKELQMMKPTVRLVNASRGGIVDERALAEALLRKQIAGAALDVFEKEPIPPDHPLLKLDNIVVTPHLAASTEEAQVKVSIDIAEQFVEFFKDGVARHTVNMVTVSDPALIPYMKLAEMLGGINTQMGDGPIRAIDVTYIGDIAGTDTTALTVAAVRGVLHPICGDSVNLVNARATAQDRGISVSEKKVRESQNFKNAIRLEVRGNHRSRTVGGTLFEGRDPRIVEINGYDVDVRPSKHMLILSYPDVPGVVGKCGSILGKQKINIARMEVGRHERGEKAVMVITLDEPVPDKILSRIRKSVKQSEVIHITLRTGRME